MNDNYIQNASAFLDSLVKEMDVKLFLEQYQSLDHDLLRDSICLNDTRIHDYYAFCLKVSEKNTTINNISSWRHLIQKASKHYYSQFISDSKLYQKDMINISYHSYFNDYSLYIKEPESNSHHINLRSQTLDTLINVITNTLNSDGIVNKAKYDTFDTDIAA